MGINVNATISMTFAIGSALAAVAGVLLCSAYPTLQPTTGSMPGIKAFTAGRLRRHRLHSGRDDRRRAAGRDRRFSARRMSPPSWATRWCSPC